MGEVDYTVTLTAMTTSASLVIGMPVIVSVPAPAVKPPHQDDMTMSISPVSLEPKVEPQPVASCLSCCSCCFCCFCVCCCPASFADIQTVDSADHCSCNCYPWPLNCYCQCCRQESSLGCYHDCAARMCPLEEERPGELLACWLVCWPCLIASIFVFCGAPLCDCMIFKCPPPSGGGSSGCIGPEANVLMAGGKTKKMKDLRCGEVLRNGAVVKFVVEFVGGGHRVMDLHGVPITRTHPVVDASGEWTRPETLAPGATEYAVSSVFSVVVQNDGPRYEYVPLCGVDGVQVNACTLGHGLQGPIIGHGFLGDRVAIESVLAPFLYHPCDGHVRVGGVVRTDGFITGFEVYRDT